jgi:hypothetical protein
LKIPHYLFFCFYFCKYFFLNISFYIFCYIVTCVLFTLYFFFLKYLFSKRKQLNDFFLQKHHKYAFPIFQNIFLYRYILEQDKFTQYQFVYSEVRKMSSGKKQLELRGSVGGFDYERYRTGVHAAHQADESLVRTHQAYLAGNPLSDEIKAQVRKGAALAGDYLPSLALGAEIHDPDLAKKVAENNNKLILGGARTMIDFIGKASDLFTPMTNETVLAVQFPVTDYGEAVFPPRPYESFLKIKEPQSSNFLHVTSSNRFDKLRIPNDYNGPEVQQTNKYLATVGMQGSKQPVLTLLGHLLGDPTMNRKTDKQLRNYWSSREPIPASGSMAAGKLGVARIVGAYGNNLEKSNKDTLTDFATAASWRVVKNTAGKRELPQLLTNVTNGKCVLSNTNQIRVLRTKQKKGGKVGVCVHATPAQVRKGIVDDIIEKIGDIDIDTGVMHFTRGESFASSLAELLLLGLSGGRYNNAAGVSLPAMLNAVALISFNMRNEKLPTGPNGRPAAVRMLIQPPITGPFVYDTSMVLIRAPKSKIVGPQEQSLLSSLSDALKAVSDIIVYSSADQKALALKAVAKIQSIYDMVNKKSEMYKTSLLRTKALRDILSAKMQWGTLADYKNALKAIPETMKLDFKYTIDAAAAAPAAPVAADAAAAQTLLNLSQADADADVDMPGIQQTGAAQTGGKRKQGKQGGRPSKDTGVGSASEEDDETWFELQEE